MSTVSIRLGQYLNKEGEAHVYIWSFVRKSYVKIPTYVYCNPNIFDEKTKRIKGNSKEVRDNNLIIGKCYSVINDILVRYRLQNKEITPDLLRQEYKNPSLYVDFYSFMEQAIEDRKDVLTDSSLKQHLSCLNKLREFKNELSFSEITNEFISNWKKFLKVKKKNGISTINNNLKNFKAYVNLAKSRGIIDSSPFDAIRIVKQKTLPEYLTEQELKKLWEIYCKGDLKENYMRTLRGFLFCCFTGLRISDYKNASHDWLIGDTLVFEPYKTKNITKKIIKIPLSKYARKLLSDEGSVTGKLFFTYSEQRLRKFIKMIVAYAGIKKDISWHTSRHTFGTLFIEKLDDVVTLKELLGHTNIAQTMIYVHVNEKKKQQQMNRFETTLFMP